MIARYRQPWHLSSRIHHEFDQLMAEAFGDSVSEVFSPSVDIVTDDADVLIMVAVAGVDSDTINVTLDGHLLTVTGTRPELALRDSDRVLSQGLSRGTFTKSFRVPRGLTPNQISASIDNGILTIRLESVNPGTSEPHRITVATPAQAVDAKPVN